MTFETWRYPWMMDSAKSQMSFSENDSWFLQNFQSILINFKIYLKKKSFSENDI